MDNMSNKAKVVYAALKEMGATSKDTKVTSNSRARIFRHYFRS